MLALVDSATGSMLLIGATRSSVGGVMSSSMDSKSHLFMLIDASTISHKLQSIVPVLSVGSEVWSLI